MKPQNLLAFLCLMSDFCLALTNQVFGQDHEAHTTEVTRISEEAKKLRAEGKIIEALSLLGRIAVIKEQLYGQNIKIAAIYHQIASEFWRNGDFDNSERNYQHALEIAEIFSER